MQARAPDTARVADSVKPIAVTFPIAKKITGLGLTTLWRLAKEKRIEITRVGRRTLITFRSLEKLLLPATDTPRPRGRGRPRKNADAKVTP